MINLGKPLWNSFCLPIHSTGKNHSHVSFSIFCFALTQALGWARLRTLARPLLLSARLCCWSETVITQGVSLSRRESCSPLVLGWFNQEAIGLHWVPTPCLFSPGSKAEFLTCCLFTLEWQFCLWFKIQTTRQIGKSIFSCQTVSLLWPFTIWS